MRASERKFLESFFHCSDIKNFSIAFLSYIRMNKVKVLPFSRDKNFYNILFTICSFSAFIVVEKLSSIFLVIVTFMRQRDKASWVYWNQKDFVFSCWCHSTSFQSIEILWNFANSLALNDISTFIPKHFFLRFSAIFHHFIEPSLSKHENDSDFPPSTLSTYKNKTKAKLRLSQNEDKSRLTKWI